MSILSYIAEKVHEAIHAISSVGVPEQIKALAKAEAAKAVHLAAEDALALAIPLVEGHLKAAGLELAEGLVEEALKLAFHGAAQLAEAQVDESLAPTAGEQPAPVLDPSAAAGEGETSPEGASPANPDTTTGNEAA